MINLKETDITLSQRDLLCRLAFGGILAILLYNAFSGTLVHQWKSPILHYPYVDFTYWFFSFSGLPAAIVGNALLALCFDILLVGSAAVIILFPRQRYLIALYLTLAFTYFMLYNFYGMAHIHSKLALVLIPIPFLCRSLPGFGFLWTGLRYYTLFIFSAAFMWKVIRGTLLHRNQGTLILKKNLAAYLYYNPETLLGQTYQWLLSHSAVVNIIFVIGCLFEGIFLVGFFTRRFDRWLIILTLLLPVGFLFIADAFFFEMSLLAISFYPLSRSGINVRAVNA